MILIFVVIPDATEEQLNDYVLNPIYISNIQLFSIEKSNQKLLLEDLRLRHQDILHLEKGIAVCFLSVNIFVNDLYLGIKFNIWRTKCFNFKARRKYRIYR